MRLTAPSLGINFKTQDIYGKPIALTDFLGKRVMLSFFRNAGCPFCNFRIYELSHKYKTWKEQGLEIVAVFSSPSEEVRRHVAKHPRPFRMISDPELAIYTRYGVEKSAMALLKAMLFKLPRVIRGAMIGLPLKNAHPTLVPADFLLDEQGMICDIWYGRDTSDHIPLPRVEAFIQKGQYSKRRATAA